MSKSRNIQIQLIISELGGTPTAGASRNQLLIEWLGALVV
jgi:hypothetical protein